MALLINLLTTILPAYICLGAGVYVFANGKDRTLNRVFLGYNLLVAILGFCEFQFRTASGFTDAVFWHTILSAWPFMAALPLHFALVLYKKHVGSLSIALLLLYFSAFLVFLVVNIPNYYQTHPAQSHMGWHSVYTGRYISVFILAWLLLVSFSAVFVTYKAYLCEPRFIVKKQLKIIFLGFGLGYFIGVFSGVLLPLAGMHMIELDKFGVMLSNIIIGYAVLKFGLFEYSAISVAESVFRDMPAAVFVTDVKGDIKLVNSAAVNLLKKRKDQIEGSNIHVFFSENQSYSTDLGEDNKKSDYLQVQDANPLPVYKTSSIVYNEGGTFIGSLVIATDISDLKKTERQLWEARDHAEESDRLKSVFLANISHEIRTPMNAILGFSQLIDQSNGVSEKHRKFLALIDKNVNNLLHIIDDLVEISKLESSKTKVIRKTFLVEDLFLRAKSSFTDKVIANNKVNLQFRLMDVDPLCPSLNSDRTLIMKVLDKLIENSVKFTEEGTIELGYQVIENTLALFYVKDSGVGIPQDKCSVIFEPFRQSEDSYTRKFGGTGVSLTIAKRYVELLGGKIWVESEEKSGTVFYFSVPIW